MAVKSIKFLFLVGTLLCVVGGQVMFLNTAYPIVGHDYRYFVPRLLDTHLHYLIEGFTVQWYTPSFGGGLPAHPNPNHIQFSLVQLLTYFMRPWEAVQWSVGIFTILGFLGTFYLMQVILSLTWAASLMGALFFSTNGFFLLHMAVGHVTFQAFPLFPLLIISLLHETRYPIVPIVSIATVLSVLVNGGGYYIGVMFLLSSFATLPLLFIHKPSLFRCKALAARVVGGTALGLLISASKLHAVYSFMQHFPRELHFPYKAGIFQGIIGLVAQLTGTPVLTIILWFKGKGADEVGQVLGELTGAYWYGFWELDTSVSPILWGILILGSVNLLYPWLRKGKLEYRSRTLFAWCLFVLGIYLIAEFAMARGILFPMLKELPVLRSLHGNTRFAAAYIFPLVILGSFAMHQIMKGWRFRWEMAFVLAVILCTFFFWGSFFLVSPKTLDISFYVSPSDDIYEQIDKGQRFPIRSIASEIKDMEVFFKGESNLTPYEPIFGYNLQDFKPEVVPGSVFEVRNEHFNMTNPSGFVFPKENRNRPFDRIPVGQAPELWSFVHRQQPDWNRPTTQKISDMISLIGVGFALVSVIFTALFRVRRNFRIPGVRK